ncbi:unnamed protein product, partial [Amoebophrya sp. A25]|eukprot:GSA25T00018362001.1
MSTTRSRSSSNQYIDAKFHPVFPEVNTRIEGKLYDIEVPRNSFCRHGILKTGSSISPSPRSRGAQG